MGGGDKAGGRHLQEFVPHVDLGRVDAGLATPGTKQKYSLPTCAGRDANGPVLPRWSMVPAEEGVQASPAFSPTRVPAAGSGDVASGRRRSRRPWDGQAMRAICQWERLAGSPRC